MANILILEDDLAIISLFSRVLRVNGYTVYEATHLAAARKHLSEHHFDLFLCDMRLGAERGIDLLAEQQEKLTEQGTRVVVVSAEEEYRKLCQDMGIDIFFSKPVSPIELNSLVGELLHSEV